MKKLIPALCMLLIAAAMLGTSTYAWFSMNRQVTATGMKVKAAAAASLVISKTATTADTNTVTVVATTEGVNFTLIDATHVDTEKTGAAYGSGLMTVDNRGDVDVSTGKKKTSGPELTYVAATNSGSTLYYVDYTFYIASRTAALENSKLQVKMDNVSNTTNFVSAISADIYVGTPAEGTFKNTLKNNGAAVDVVLDTNTIPQAGDGDIVLVLRVYIDGEDANVTTEKHSVEDMSFNVTINAVDLP